MPQCGTKLQFTAYYSADLSIQNSPDCFSNWRWCGVKSFAQGHENVMIFGAREFEPLTNWLTGSSLLHRVINGSVVEQTAQRCLGRKTFMTRTAPQRFSPFVVDCSNFTQAEERERKDIKTRWPLQLLVDLNRSWIQTSLKIEFIFTSLHVNICFI